MKKEDVVCVRLFTFCQTDANGKLFTPDSISVENLDLLVKMGKIKEYDLSNGGLDVWFI